MSKVWLIYDSNKGKMKKFTILLIFLLSINLCFARDNDEHLRSFITMISTRSFQSALNEMSLISNWANDDDLPSIDIRDVNAFISYYSFFHPAGDNFWTTDHFDSLCVYIIPHLEQFVQSCRTDEEYISAYRTIESITDFVEDKYGRKHPFFLYGKNYLAITSGKYFLALGQLYMEKNNYNLAIESFQKAYPLLKDYKNGVSEELWILSKDLTIAHFARDEYDAAKAKMELALFIAKELHGNTSSKYCLSLYNMGIIMKESGQYKESKKYIEEAHTLLMRYHSEDTIARAKCSIILGFLHMQEGMYEEAQAELLDVITMLKKYHKGQTVELGQAYNYLGMFCHTVYEDALALESYKKAEKIYQQVLPNWQHSTEYADTEGNLAQIYLSLGLNEEAEKKLRAAINIKKELYGEKHDACALGYNDLSLMYMNEGQYDSAYAYADKAHQILKEIKPENHPFFAVIHMRKGQIQYAMNNHQAAIDSYNRSAEIQKQVCDSCIEYANILLQCAEIYKNQENFEMVSSLLQQALPIIEKNVSSETQMTVVALNQIASFLGRSNNDSLLLEAENYYLLALELMDSMPFYNPSIYAAICNNLGALYFNENKYDSSLKYHKMTLEKTRLLKRREEMNDAISYLHIGHVYSEIKNYKKAEKYIRTGTDMIKGIFYKTQDYMSTNMREKFWGRNSDLLMYSIFPLVYRYYPSNHAIAQWAYDNELFLKGALLSSYNTIKHSIEESGDSLLLQQWNELIQLKNTIYREQERNPSSPDVEKHIQQSERLEQEITRRSTAYREKQFGQKLNWKDIRKQLKTNEVAIEFQAVQLTKEDSTLFCALLLRHNSAYPILIRLFEFREMLKEFYETNNRYSYLGNEDHLSHLIWHNILPHLKEGETIYFAPVGLLHQIPIENLPYDSIRTMNDVFNMVRLSSTREIVLHQNTSHQETAALYGGIKYDASIDELAGESAQYGTFASRSLRNDTIDRGRVTYLPGTREEIEDIQQTLFSKHIHVVSHTKVSATEESFKALSGTHTNIIHLATHGFYWEAPAAKQEKFFAQHISGLGEEYSLNVSIDPLDRCGLLFAGANTALSGHSDRLPKNIQDGILTAKEISTMDLRDADIVVLSACETGLGDISGEGVFGLQRAFKMAGAQSILMALWKVDDEATKTLMTAFYRYYCQGNNKRQALRLAQQEVHKNGYSNPYYWAGFVLLD